LLALWAKLHCNLNQIDPIWAATGPHHAQQQQRLLHHGTMCPAQLHGCCQMAWAEGYGLMHDRTDNNLFSRAWKQQGTHSNV
jgi:hypothetical protein